MTTDHQTRREQELPPLPMPAVPNTRLPMPHAYTQGSYTAEQMRAYVLADRSSRLPVEGEGTKDGPWKQAVQNACILFEFLSDDPQKSVDAIIDWHVSVAIDPQVSSDAQALIDRGRVEGTKAVPAKRVDVETVLQFIRSYAGKDALNRCEFAEDEDEGGCLTRMLYALAAPPAPAETEAEQPSAQRALAEIEQLLTNLQPHIVQACFPGHAQFIDTYVDQALAIARGKGETT